MNSKDFQFLTLKEIVTENFQTAAVFEKFSLDFCCRGGKSINEACSEKGIDPQIVYSELESIASEKGHANKTASEWVPDVLIDHIIQKHHSYVTKMIPILYAHTQKVAAVHGANHPEVVEIAKHFETVAMELQQHMVKEERMLFPYVQSLQTAKKQNTGYSKPQFGSVQNPIKMMEAEHQNAGDEMYSIRALSNNYTPPIDACTTYRITFQELQEFERDLHQHVHLENNILFPMAVALEQELISKN